MKTKKINRLIYMLPLLLLAAACSFPAENPPTPTGLNSTQVQETVNARITEVFAETLRAGTNTPLPSETLVVPTDTPTLTEPVDDSGIPTAPQPVSVTPSPSPTQLCDQAAPGDPVDVTIPDDTEFEAGETFVKTWRLVNIGACTWSGGYEIAWVSGDRLGAAESVPIPADVGPGVNIDLSVSMTAPDNPGTYRGNWMMKNAAGELFGFGSAADGAFWVQIVVVETDDSPPPVKATGFLTVTLDTHIDLDSLLFSADGGDILYQAGGPGHLLTPEGGALLGVFGAGEPGWAACNEASIGPAPLQVEPLAIGTYLCYRTGDGLVGWLRVDGFDADTFDLGITALTWEAKE